MLETNNTSKNDNISTVIIILVEIIIKLNQNNNNNNNNDDNKNSSFSFERYFRHLEKEKYFNRYKVRRASHDSQSDKSGEKTSWC